jgi:D-amino-acid oxidase
VVPEPESLARLPFEGLEQAGRRYQTWLLNPRIMLPALVRELRERGVTFHERLFDTRASLGTLGTDVVVNCTGWGAKALVGDDAMIAQRGHLVLLQRPSPQHDYFFTGGCGNGPIFYVHCRHDDIVIGGTVVGGDDRDTVWPEDTAIFERLLHNARKMFGGQPRACRWG